MIVSAACHADAVLLSTQSWANPAVTVLVIDTAKPLPDATNTQRSTAQRSTTDQTVLPVHNAHNSPQCAVGGLVEG